MPRNKEEQLQLRLFGGNVRRERVLRGLTQARLAELIDLNIRYLQKIEAGETNVLVTTVMRICKALGCTAGKLIPENGLNSPAQLKSRSRRSSPR